MLQIFQVCFITGLILIVIAFIFGQFFDFIGIDGLDLSGVDINLLVPFSPTLLFLFATIFGGVGILLYKYLCLSVVVATIVAAFSGFIVCFVIHKCIIVPLKKAENTSAPENDELIGLLGKVNERIPKNGFGAISYVFKGNTYEAPAKSTDKEEIKAGTSVSICWIEDHVFYVSNIDKLQ